MSEVDWELCINESLGEGPGVWGVCAAVGVQCTVCGGSGGREAPVLLCTTRPAPPGHLSNTLAGREQKLEHGAKALATSSPEAVITCGP